MIENILKQDLLAIPNFGERGPIRTLFRELDGKGKKMVELMDGAGLLQSFCK